MTAGVRANGSRAPWHGAVKPLLNTPQINGATLCVRPAVRTKIKRREARRPFGTASLFNGVLEERFYNLLSVAIRRNAVLARRSREPKRFVVWKIF